MAQRQDWLSARLDRQKAIQTRLETLPDEVARLKSEVAALEATCRAQGRGEKPHSRLAKAHRRLAAARKKLKKASQQLQQAQRAAATHRRRLECLQAEHAELSAHLAQLRADNEHNPDPVTIILRIDAGFGTGPNITWLCISNCPYPLTVALERFHTPNGLKHDDGRALTLPAWFDFYNARQIIALVHQ